MARRQENRRFSLGAKLNLILIASILLVALGLLLVTYNVYCDKVDHIYFEQVERAARGVSEQCIPYEFVSFMRRVFSDREFREVRARAVAAGDEKIIEDWMREQPPIYYEMANFENENLSEEEKEQYTLWGDYSSFVTFLKSAEEVFGLKSAYIQYVVDGVTFNLVDPDEALFTIGTIEEPVYAFDKYTGNERIPATVYNFRGNTLCTACEPIVEESESGMKTVVGLACVDIDMSDVMRERHWFLLNSAVLIVVLTLLAMAVGVYFTRGLATKPLKLLSAGATGFAKGDGGFSREDIIRLPIDSNDEVGDLYREIRSMQGRIVDNADRLTRITADRERVKTELSMAADIQNSALPRRFPAFPDRPEFDLYASMDPAKEVGGDFYDFFLVDDDHLALVIADVSDKGVPAALFMMSAKNLISYRAAMGGSPGEILTSVNAQLCKDNDMKMFVTVWLGILELSTGRLTCVNAGHECPILKHPDGPFQLLRDRHGVFMGVMKKATYREYDLELLPGSKLFVYTDGLAEANNQLGEQFGTDRIVQALNRCADGSPMQLLDGVTRAVNGFTAGATQFDDMTMLCLEYRGTGNERG